jgi:hypothetical protein
MKSFVSVTALSMTKFRSFTDLSNTSERQFLINIALPVFIVARTVFSVASAGDHQPMMSTLQQTICCDELFSNSDHAAHVLCWILSSSKDCKSNTQSKMMLFWVPFERCESAICAKVLTGSHQFFPLPCWSTILLQFIFPILLSHFVWCAQCGEHFLARGPATYCKNET